MPAIRDVAAIAKKWARVTPARADDYRLGVENPKKDYKTATMAAEPAYEAGVQQAIARKAFGKGVAKAGTEKWKKGAVEKGTARFGPGVAVAEPEYMKGFEPYQKVIASLLLPPRRPKGDPANIERVRAIATALHRAKIGRT